MGVFCDRRKLCSTAAPDCLTGQNKGRYREQELSFLLVSLSRGQYICKLMVLTSVLGPEYV